MAEKDYDKVRSELEKSGHRVPLARFVEDDNAGQVSAEKESGDGGAAAGEIDESDSEHGYHGKLMSRDEFEKKLKAGPDENKGVTAVTPHPTAAAKAAEADAAKPAAKRAARKR